MRRSIIVTSRTETVNEMNQFEYTPTSHIVVEKVSGRRGVIRVIHYSGEAFDRIKDLFECKRKDHVEIFEDMNVDVNRITKGKNFLKG